MLMERFAAHTSCLIPDFHYKFKRAGFYRISIMYDYTYSAQLYSHFRIISPRIISRFGLYPPKSAHHFPPPYSTVLAFWFWLYPISDYIPFIENTRFLPWTGYNPKMTVIWRVLWTVMIMWLTIKRGSVGAWVDKEDRRGNLKYWEGNLQQKLSFVIT